MLAAMTDPRTIAVLALLTGAVGIYVQILGGNVPGYPAIAPGVLVFLGGAAITWFVPLRVAPIAAVLVALFMIIGLFAADQATRLTEVEAVWDTIGLWIQMIAVVVALVAGVVAIARPSSSSRD